MLNNVRRYALKNGKTIPLVLSMIDQTPHPSPVLHLEYLGHTNKQWVGDQLLDTADVVVAKTIDDLDVNDKKDRATLAKYIVRKIEHFYHDGSDGEPDFSRPVASDDAGIAMVCEALPRETVMLAFRVARNEERFRERPRAKPEDVAKKS